VRELVYYVAVTLDGFIAGPDGGDPTGEVYFPLHDDLLEFIVTEFPETLPGPARKAMGIDAPGKNFDTALEGRSTYEIGRAAGITNAYPHLRHLVFSTTMGQSPDPTVELVATTRCRQRAHSRPRTASTSGSSAEASWHTHCCPRSTA
jgi:hypothetical protein